MKLTISKLCASIIATAGEIGSESERIPDDAGIADAEAIIALRDAQRCLRVAQDALRLAIAHRAMGGGSAAISRHEQRGRQKRPSTDGTPASRNCHLAQALPSIPFVLIY